MPHFSDHAPGYKRRLNLQCRNSWFHKRGSIDAWVMWDPRTAAANKQIDARILASATPCLRYGFQPLFSTTKIA